MKLVRIFTIPACAAVFVLALSSFKKGGGSKTLNTNQSDTLIPSATQKEIDQSIQRAMKEIQSIDWNKINDEWKQSIAGIDFSAIGKQVRDAMNSIRWDEINKSVNKASGEINSKKFIKELRKNMNQIQSELKKSFKEMDKNKQNFKKQQENLKKEQMKLELLKRELNENYNYSDVYQAPDLLFQGSQLWEYPFFSQI